MKKIQVLALALFSVFALSAIAVASASAETTVWLVDGKAIVNPVAVEVAGSVLLADLKTPLGEAAILCSGLFIGTVGPGAADEITGVLNLNSELTSNGVLTELGLESADCVNERECPSPLVWAENLPWLTILSLMEGGLILDLFFKEAGKQPAFEVDCSTIIGLIEDLCEGETSVDLENMPTEGDVLGSFNQAELEAEGLLGTCTLGGPQTAVLATDTTDEVALIFTTSPGHVLAVSTE